MFATLKLDRGGAVVEHTLPKGSTALSGSMGSGKSIALRGVVALLTGEAVPGLTAIGTTHGGRRLSVGPKGRGILEKGSDTPARYGSAEAYRAALGAIGLPTDAELVRLVVDPDDLLRRLTGAVADTRALLGIVLRALPAQDARAILAELMGGDLRDEDPAHLEDATVARGAPRTPGALSLQREANAAADRADGALTQARATLAAMGPKPALIPDADLEAARALVAAANTWTEYARARAGWEGRQAARSAAEARVTAWERARAALGPAPAYDADAHMADAAALAADTARAEAEAKARAEAEAKARADAERAAAEKARTAADVRQEPVAAAPLFSAHALNPGPSLTAPNPPTVTPGAVSEWRTHGPFAPHVITYVGDLATTIDGRAIAAPEPA